MLTRLKDLATRAGRWLGRAGTPPAPPVVQAVTGDRFDAMTWRETYEQAPALAEMAEDLGESYDHASDLLKDVCLAAYKTAPTVRDAGEMDPGRRVNHQVVRALLAARDFGELRRHTVGDPYAAAMAVVPQRPELERMLKAAKEAAAADERERQAQQRAAEAAQDVADALAAAAATGGGGAEGESGDENGAAVDEQAAGTVEAAIAAAQAADTDAEEAAEEAEAAHARLAPTLRTGARAAAAAAAQQVEAEAEALRGWGLEPGELQKMPFWEREELARRLTSGKLRRFAELIGRFRRLATAQRARRIEHVPGELVGVTLGDDLSRLVPSELAALGVPELRPVFASRFAEAQLMLYDSRGEDRAGQGAIIALVDNSYSMADTHGHTFGGPTGEAWAKALALALLDQARASKRDFVGINFASTDELAVFRFPAAEPAGAARARAVEFTEHFFGGGTDFITPVSAAVRLLEAEHTATGRRQGDIVLITDGLAAVDEGWMRDYQDAKHTLGFRTFGVAIGTEREIRRATEPGSVLDALCDNLRGINDLTTDGGAADSTADLFRTI